MTLRKLQEEYDELFKNKEEQDERLDAIKYKNEGLNATQEQLNLDLETQANDMLKMQDLITDAKNRTQEKVEEKKEL